ncbi:hypothetical protein [Streptomyces sp. NPDC007117]|uniref:hypothetical protein n=1 Tax=Streptomyces sp. NPDC007117 TaxID=3154314 RepID=UPI0033EF5A53
MTTENPPIDRDKSHLTAVGEEAVRLADVLENHPGTSDVTDADVRGDIVFTAAGRTWALDFQSGPDGEIFQDPTGTPAPANTPAADVLRDVVIPRAPGPPRLPCRHRRRRHPHGPPGHRPPLHPGPQPRRLTLVGTPRAWPRHRNCRGQALVPHTL